MKSKTYSIILARGGSKGIKNKNLVKINNKPLIFWTIFQSLKSKKIDEVWVSSDSKKILSISKKIGANIIKRPKKYSGDRASSESAWIHAINSIKDINHKKDIIVAPQITSPIRSKNDFNEAIKKFNKHKLDSLFSGFFFEVFFSWKYKKQKVIPKYNLKRRPQRQRIHKNIVENGSFYIFKANGFLKSKNRLFGKIGCHIMKKDSSFQIDEKDDVNFFNFLSNKKKLFK